MVNYIAYVMEFLADVVQHLADVHYLVYVVHNLADVPVCITSLHMRRVTRVDSMHSIYYLVTVIIYISHLAYISTLSCIIHCTCHAPTRSAKTLTLSCFSLLMSCSHSSKYRQALLMSCSYSSHRDLDIVVHYLANVMLPLVLQRL